MNVDERLERDAELAALADNFDRHSLQRARVAENSLHRIIHHVLTALKNYCIKSLEKKKENLCTKNKKTQ